MSPAPRPPYAYRPLTPTTYLLRSAVVHRDRAAVVAGAVRRTYGELAERCRRLAGALEVRSGGRPVAILAPNTPMLLEAHFGVPWAGVPLVALNVRLSAPELQHIVAHAGAGLLLCDESLSDVARSVAASVPGLSVIEDSGPGGGYESMLDGASALLRLPSDEMDVLAVNYTSGTTGRPKGVLYHHRGAFLQSLAMVAHTGLTASSRYLWTLPMFHCNGWSFPWAVTAAGATHVCLPRVDVDEVWRLISEEGITHLCGAPTVLSMLAASSRATPMAPRSVHVATGGAPPTPALLARLESLGFEVTHLYGLTETFGPSAICDWMPEWDDLDQGGRAAKKARQGVGNVVGTEVTVLDEAGRPVPADGTTVGEIALRGNTVMLGYLDDEDATEAATGTGWFRSGDLAVLHPDGYVEIRDRAKDVIISGGENISSVEVERAIAEHPSVLEAAVVAAPDAHWGEIPVAYVALAEGASLDVDELVEHLRERIAGFKVPKRVVFGDLPKTSTGKIQKFELRARAAEDAPVAG